LTDYNCKEWANIKFSLISPASEKCDNFFVVISNYYCDMQQYIITFVKYHNFIAGEAMNISWGISDE